MKGLYTGDIWGIYRGHILLPPIPGQGALPQGLSRKAGRLAQQGCLLLAQPGRLLAHLPKKAVTGHDARYENQPKITWRRPHYDLRTPPYAET